MFSLSNEKDYLMIVPKSIPYLELYTVISRKRLLTTGNMYQFYSSSYTVYSIIKDSVTLASTSGSASGKSVLI